MLLTGAQLMAALSVVVRPNAARRVGRRRQLDHPLTVKSVLTSDYQLGNWLVTPCRPLYLRVKGCLPCPVDYRHRPSQTVGSGTQRARMTYVGGSDLAVRGWTGLRGRSALQVLGSAAAAFDRPPRGPEQAASGESCG